MKRAVFVMLTVLLSTAFAKVWYVHPDSTQDSIQPYLDACAGGDTVLVAAGTYHEKLVWPNTQSIKLWSESGPASTVIDGDSSGTVITMTAVVDTTTAIEGFTITGGYSENWGGGILVLYGGPMIRDNIITGNEALDGGGMEADFNDSIYILNNRFIRNHAHRVTGGVSVYQGIGFVIGNTFEQNSCDSQVGGLLLQQAAGRVAHNTFTGNRAGLWGGGLLCYLDVTAPIDSNTFAYDSAGITAGGMYFVVNASPSVVGNSVSNCYSGQAAAVHCDNASPGFVGDTFTDNTSTWYHGTVYCANGSSPHFGQCLIAGNSMAVMGAITAVDSSAPTIDSCTITGNACAGVYVGAGSRPSITHSNICGNRGYGVNCEYHAESVEAYNNWWGDSTGPFHPDSNPGGRGDTVSDGVFFRPWLTDSVFFPGVLESNHPAPVGLPTEATIVRGVLLMGDRGQTTGHRAALLDVVGREVMKLKPGANDARTLTPGVYFVYAKGQKDEGVESSSMRKVVIAR